MYADCQERRSLDPGFDRKVRREWVDKANAFQDAPLAEILTEDDRHLVKTGSGPNLSVVVRELVIPVVTCPTPTSPVRETVPTVPV
jgi:hypothetical protein